MAAGDVIGSSVCDCGDKGTVQWKESKGGSASGKCLTCHEQRWKRSPNAVDRLKRQLAGSPPPPPEKKEGEQGAAGGGERKPFDPFLDKFK